MASIGHAICCKRASIAGVLLALAIESGAQAEIYKCVVDGKVQFSDRRCAPSAERLIVDTKPTGADLGASGDTSSITDPNSLAALDRQIADLDRKYTQMSKDFDRKHAALNKMFDDAPRTAVGNYRKETILIELDNLRMIQEQKILPVARMLGILRGKRNALARIEEQKLP